ncbi:MAG: glycosyltransferase [Candidatus Saccharibacteria bacterium]
MKLIFDLQILQTPARFRGMGQYVTSLLQGYHGQLGSKQDNKVYFILTNQMDIGSGLRKKLKQVFPAGTIVELPLVTLESEKSTERAQEHNRALLDAWIKEQDLGDAVFCIPALFQTEIYPVFPSQTKRSLIAYDVIPLQMPGRYAPLMRWHDYLYRFNEMYNADLIMSISKTTSNALQVYSGVPAQKITVINGGPAILPKAQNPTVDVGRKFILMPTGNDVRKNNANAIKGFDLFNSDNANTYTLVVTSFFSTEEEETLKTLSPSSEIIFTGSVDDAEMAWLYKNCEAVLFPSVLEGLGMPLIEGLQNDKPVIASSIDVFREISEDLPYYFNPFDPLSIASTLQLGLNDPGFNIRKKKYGAVVASYSWEESAKAMSTALIKLNESDARESETRKKVAVLCPIPSGISAIGKIVAEMHPELAQQADVEYFFELPTLSKELRPNILGEIAPNWNVSHFDQKRYRSYDEVYYHIGNGNHHSLTTICALTMPGVVILHDLNIEGVYNDLLSSKKIDQNRYDVEVELNKRTGDKSKFLSSLINRQRAVVVHSDYAEAVVKNLLQKDTTVKIARVNLATPTPTYMIGDNSTREPFIIGLAGILANIKGLGVIESLAKDPAFKHDKIMLFGLNFAEPGSLDRLRSLPNVSVETDLSDYEFQQKLRELSVFINYRTHYQGEASSATLEAMRYGIPVVVRSDFGWYAELPDASVIKVKKEEDIRDALVELRDNPDQLRAIGLEARRVTESSFNIQDYVQSILGLVGHDE